ncbi:MAG: transglycosylase domain-containing protein [Bacteroidales bacterium]|uniref:penicillin-binding protein 1A n=1 Tax=Candidatus Cryptobacteroides sp. TaxID=2952915 RepID=UPI002A724570|nr:transglycosylase domain-containing protein [Candidatus Cryptobacteroides sp.]MDD5914292.1 transglycosylase domain-containing protein [Bacteroidales bacterium]MDD6828632.1 transglycosylase domain-containing protein [Bacteroidales bacterium]MDD7134814.1 transglycosylase domain-containing protein [Bacteroidales bacterium]MDD7235298.1 transglycosylase domain-containing protein [Bacteroidales bacterium]MDD7624443.1 transglycosylase domain-containing protein [Bacteroidales bacterium]
MTEATKKKISKWFWILVISPFALLMFLVLLVWMFADIPSFAELENPDNKLATQIIAEDGEILTTFHIENRTYVSYDELSENLVHAAVATEDVRFYRHSGIDFIGLGRVLFKTILLSNSSQGGGSTITQQLAKTLYPRAEMEKKIPGIYHIKMVWTKLKEWITAVKLERDYTKDEIMTMYLNSIFFGSGAYGVRAASETFFGKHPSELTIEESAMLVGMVNKPTRYNPALNPDKALVRRNFVIGQMEKAGYFDDQAKAAGVKTTAFRDSIRQIPIELNYQVQDHNSGHAPYFRDMVRRVMSAKKPKRSSYSVPEDYTADSLSWATDDLYGWLEKNKKADGTPYDLDRDGLRIYTTINYKMQKYAEEAVQERMRDLQADFRKDLRHKTNKPFSNDIDAPTRDRLMQQARKWSDRYRVLKKKGLNDSQIFKTFSEPVNMRVFAYNKKGYIDTTMTPDDSIRYYKSILRTAFVAMEPGTGHVKAYVGGPDYRYFKYDNVRQGKRQVGSTIKPFLYTLAMQEGLTPCTKVTNVPVTFLTPGGETWTPRSTDKEEWIGKTVTLKWGLTNSSNNISAFLMKQYGPEAMADMMKRMGIQSHVDEVPSLCVGPADLTLWEMVAAYNTFPSRGVYVTPLFVTRIEDRQGNVLSEFTNRKREAIAESTAYLMVNLMEGVVQGGTASRLRYRYNLTGEIAGKTGTTNDNSDGWFIGYTPTLVAGVWTGAEDRQVHFQSITYGQGAHMSLPTWGIFMKKVLADGTLGISADDRFVAPAGEFSGLDCTGGDNDASEVYQSKEEEYYFE